jgi:hypothetical protein
VDDLGKVPGIGPGIMKQIRPEVTTTGKTISDISADTKTKPAEAKKTEPAKGTTAKADEKKAEKK